MRYDGDTEAMVAIRHHLPLPDQERLDRDIQRRAEAFRSGVAWTPAHVARRLREIDTDLRCRWDPWRRAPVIERWAPIAESWAHVCEWPTEAGQPIGLLELVQRLRDGDTRRWPSPQAWLGHKRSQAAARRREIERQQTEKVLAAVDGLSRKQVHQFLEVETALRTGETIEAHGEDEKQLDRAYDRSRRAAAAGEPAPPEGGPVNPWMAPDRYIRPSQREREMSHDSVP